MTLAGFVVVVAWGEKRPVLGAFDKSESHQRQRLLELCFYPWKLAAGEEASWNSGGMVVHLPFPRFVEV